MFVLKSTYEAAQAQLRAAERETAACHKEALNMRGERDAALAQLDFARAELKTTFVRGARGRIVRHPSAGE